MEYLNKVELQGIVGRVNTQTIQERTFIRFAIATNRTYEHKDGFPVIETTWFNISFFPSEDALPRELRRGDKVHVIGRLRTFNYTDNNGEQRHSFEIFAHSVQIIED